MMKKLIVFLSLFVSFLYSHEYRAYDIGGNEINSMAKISIEGEEYTLLPFSYLDIKKDDVNLDGDFTLLFPKVNGEEISPIKLASNYKLQSIVIKVFKSSDTFDESTLITQSKEIFINDDAMFFSIDIKKD